MNILLEITKTFGVFVAGVSVGIIIEYNTNVASHFSRKLVDWLH